MLRSAFRLALIVIVPVIAVTLAFAQQPFALKDTDTVAMLGDSITAQHLHSNYIEAYVLTRYPGWQLRPWTRNCTMPCSQNRVASVSSRRSRLGRAEAVRESHFGIVPSKLAPDRPQYMPNLDLRYGVPAGATGALSRSCSHWYVFARISSESLL